MDQNRIVDQQNRLKVYVKPEIVYELELETRAGSPIGMGDPFHLLDGEG